MSSGSNAPRKPNVAAASTSLFKASSRFLHSGERNGPAGAGGPGKGVKRQRAGGASFDSAESNNITEVSRCFAVADHKDSTGAVKSKKRFVGVRQRPSGRWVAEIKDTTQKIRLWLGTFDSAEEGAKAYDSAARALRGANTRTNFVPALACEGTVPASKAARLIRLRQIAAASKASEKEAARNVEPKGADDHPNVKVESSPVNPSPLVRQDLQQSISSLDSPAAVDDHTVSLLPSPKPARLMGRRHNAPLASAKPEQFDDVDAPPFHDHGTVVDTGPKSKLDVTPSPPKLEPQQSITSDNLSNAITHSLTAGSPQESSSSPGPLRLPSPRSPFECMQPTKDAVAGGAVQSVTNTFVEATESHLKSFNPERFTTHRLESLAFPVDDFVAPPPIPFHDMASLEASTRPSLYPHQISSSCATNRDMYAAAATSEKDEEVFYRGRSLRSTFGCHNQPMNPDDVDDDDDAMNLDDGKHNCVDTVTKCEARVIKEESAMEYPSSEGCILREREFGVPELVMPEIPWPDYVLMDEMGIDSTGLLGLDLSCETSGVYTSAFDFSAEAIDRDSCTSGVLLEEHTSKFFRMPYEQSHSPPASQDFRECVLLTEPPELNYSLSPHEPGPPPLSPRETTTSSSLLWRLDDTTTTTTTTTTTWDGQSSGSTTDVKPQQSGDASGECTSSQDHEALWSSMDLPPLCMVASRGHELLGPCPSSNAKHC